MFTEADIFRHFPSVCQFKLRVFTTATNGITVKALRALEIIRKYKHTGGASPKGAIFMLKCFHLFLSYVHILPT